MNARIVTGPISPAMLDAALDAASELFGLSREMITSRHRTQGAADARIALYAALSRAGAGDLAIAAAFNRDRSSAYEGRKSAELSAAHDADYAERIARITAAAHAAAPTLPPLPRTLTDERIDALERQVAELRGIVGELLGELKASTR